MRNSFLENLIETGAVEGDEDLFPTYDYVEEDIKDQSNATYIINIILSGAARLNALLPTATILAFTLLHRLITNDGQCTSLTRWMMGCFLALTAASSAHSDVLSCYNVDLPRKMTVYVPLLVELLISAVYVIFPTRRKGIGYPFMLQNDLSTATTEV
ncbi:hypothetical protein ACET3Z_020764 [Daucus carota]